MNPRWLRMAGLRVKLDQGFIYAPYIPVLMTPMMDTATLPNGKIMSRYGKKEVNQNYAGLIPLPHLDDTEE